MDAVNRDGDAWSDFLVSGWALEALGGKSWVLKWGIGAVISGHDTL